MNSEMFCYLIKKIKDKSRAEKQIVANIRGNKLEGYWLEEHIKYSLENQLNQCYNHIGRYIKNNEYIGFKYDILKSYTDLIDESKIVSFLKGCCKDLDSMLCWNAVKIFIERDCDNPFIIKLSKKYLLLSRCEEKDYNFIGNALSVLFYTNHKDSLKEYYLALKDKENRRDDFTIETINDFKSFSDKDITEIEKIFYLVYNDKIIDNFAYYSAKSYLAILVSNCSNNKKDYDRIKALINKMLKKSDTNDTYVFFLNHLLKGADTTYYNSLVRQYSFSEAKALLEYKKQDVTIMLKDVLYACNLTQQNKLFWGTEDERTKQVLDLLSMKYTTKDQSRYGISSGGKSAGEVDGVISDLSGVEKFIEAINLKSIDKNSLSSHISKLEQKYDSKGLKEKYLIIYHNSSSKFQDFCTRYYKYINSEYQFYYRKTNMSIEKVDYVEQYLIKSTHLRNGQEVYLYHILLNMRE
ncbi:hypothetical protein HX014_15700 [Myroides marinus]|uniref:hypothetical protein n=1 Tax=Myroides marinus TaxID=703342 RepID=UPI0025760B61|nr:hypothetical protein [Myroides marinus]MDM1352072.1 hypothetical protein [Myroides marinus]MDM1359242.1 hypothetical protein [Myroides marinus]